MESELKPCPFCGTGVRTNRNLTGGIYIWCPNDECVMPDIEAEEECEDERTMAMWNTRASDWTPITPENLPTLADEMWDGAITLAVDELTVGISYTALHEDGWTHFRAINAPPQASEPPDRSFGRPAEERTRRTPVDAISTPIVQPVPVPLVERMPEAPHD